MTTSLAVALYIVIWWLTLFVVLPFGVKTQGEAGDVVEGTPESAPVAPRILRTLVINTFVAAVTFVFVWTALEYDWLGLYRDIQLGVPGGVH
jgi:predicted secreted protein